MLTSLFHTLKNPDSFWREVFRHGLLAKHRTPADWFLFRHEVSRECAMRRRDPEGGPIRQLIEEIFPDISKVQSQVKLVRPNAYNLSWAEIITVSQLVSMLSPRTLFEFGTFDGKTTLHLALNSPKDAIVYTIDKERGTFDFGTDRSFFGKVSVGECFLSTPVEKKICLLTGNTRQFDFTPFIRKVDFTFVDADHSYEGVMNDSERAFDIIRPGGLIVWHDYLLIGDVTKAIVDICKNKDLRHLKGTSLVICREPSETGK